MVGEIPRSSGDVIIKDEVLRELKNYFDTKGNIIDSKSAADKIIKRTEKITNPWKFGVTVTTPDTYYLNALWKKVASYIATGPLKASDRSFVNHAMSSNGMKIDSQMAELSGIINSGFMTVIGSGVKLSLSVMFLSDTPQQGITNVFSNVNKMGSVAADKAGQRYQGAEIKSKAGIVGSQLL